MGGNPFTYGNPISDPRRFFGRAREVQQIFGRLRNEEFESSSVVGERRIGKTSLLNYLADPGVRAAHGLEPERYAFVYVDLQMVNDAMGPEQLWRRLLALTRRRCSDDEIREFLARLERSDRLDTFDLDELFQGSYSSLKERAGVKRGFACGFASAELFAGHAKLAPWLLPFLCAGAVFVRAGWPGQRTGRSPAALAAPEASLTRVPASR